MGSSGFQFGFFMMDLRASEDIGGIETLKKMDNEEAGMNSKVKGTGGVSSKEMIFRADKIDLKSLDLQLERHLSKVWSSTNANSQRPKEEWEIDLSKMDIRYVIAHGTYGTVYRGTYDNQDVAGDLSIVFSSHLYFFFFLVQKRLGCLEFLAFLDFYNVPRLCLPYL